MSCEPNAALDSLHAECLVARSLLRAEFASLAASAALWEPRQLDPAWLPSSDQSRALRAWLADPGPRALPVGEPQQEPPEISPPMSCGAEESR